jgi:hypothetical protein
VVGNFQVGEEAPVVIRPDQGFQFPPVLLHIRPMC